ncbi:MAG: SpoIID/LytB domain-containing protein, partial [Sandaracinaceae bacterium]
MRSAPLVLLGLLTACDPASVDPARVDPARVDPCSAPRGDVQGIVTDGLDGAALSGVRVRSRACPAEALSDSRGELTLRLPAGDYDLWLDRADYIEGQRAHVTVEAGASVAIDLHLFPIDPSDAAIDAYFARQPVRRHAHPAHERPRVSPTVADDEVGAARQGLDESMLPSVIRVWRAGGTAIEPSAANGFADRSCDPTAVVDVLPREDYVKGVIPHEWIPSWHPEALRAGAIAARSYAVNWWARGGRWDCADVDDGTVTQVYRDDRSATTNEAVDATAGQVIMMGGSIVSAEYSAENSDPTATGVAEPTCTGTTRNGHGRGMCQWGTHRWASAICANAPCDFSAFGGATPRDYTWIVQHYFPSATLESCGTPAAPCGSIPAGGGIVDDTDLCFTAFGPAMYWRTEAAGWQDQLRWTNAFEASSPSNWARWTL